MQFDERRLMEFLKEVDKVLKKRIRLTAVGGTALTLLKAKTSTIDMDFDLSEEDLKEFRDALKRLQHGFKIDLFSGGFIFCQQLPEDYADRSVAVTELANISLHSLSPLDVVVTKIGRLNDRDIEDIRSCISKFSLTRKQIAERARQAEYAGREENYQFNLRHVLEKLCVS